MITESEEARIGETQFRSFEFSPRVATYLLRYGTIRGATKIPIAEIPDAPGAVYFIDKFEKYGNCKTTLVAEDVFPKDIAEKLASGTISSSEQITTLNTRFGALPVYRRLKDVPEGVLAVIVGSSGLGHQRFLEIVVQGGSAQNQLGLSAGDSLY
jgi:S-adenosylmethionine hydrolase